MALSDIIIPPFLYFPTHLLGAQGPKHWARLRFLQACERLDIPQKLWPAFGGRVLSVPLHYQTEYGTNETFSLPRFNAHYETESEWRQRARAEFEAYLDKWSRVFNETLADRLREGKLTRITQVRGDTPIEIRYEWAAKRYCLRLGFKEMETDEHSANKISKTVTPILMELGLRKRK